MTLPRDWMNRKDDMPNLEDESLKDGWMVGKILFLTVGIVAGLGVAVYSLIQLIR